MSAASEIDTAKILSSFAANLTFGDIPADALETTKMFIADYYAACFAGMRVNVSFNEAIWDITKNASATGSSSVLEQTIKLPAETAAYMNAIYAHGADMDDGNRKAMGHVAAHVMSAVFALAESLQDKTWADVTVAIIVGYEVYNRVAAMAQPGLVHRGFHSTGTAGAIACAAATSKLLGLDEKGIYAAMGIAAIQASGLIIIAESGQACKPLNPANAAKTGIVATKLAANGIKGPERPLESDKGWFHAMTDQVNYSALDDLGSVYTICESYLKPYPSCRHTHCGIEAAMAIREELEKGGKDYENIDSVKLFTYGNAIQIAGQIKVPQTMDEAKFSIHYSLAVALKSGDYTLTALSQRPAADVCNLVDKIELVRDDSMENTAAGIRGARLVVALDDGRAKERTVFLPKGDVANPFTWDDMNRKLEACLYGFNYSAEKILQEIRNICFSSKYESIKAVLLAG